MVRIHGAVEWLEYMICIQRVGSSNPGKVHSGDKKGFWPKLSPC